MAVQLVGNNYGKSRVRLMKTARRGDLHEMQEISVNIAFEGEFTAVHTLGDNSRVLPTDTMKNTVYALAWETAEIEEIEVFGLRLADHFLSRNRQVSRAIVEILESRWSRIDVGGRPHDEAFVKNGNEKKTTRIDASREGAKVESGITDLIVLKTARSGFAGFIKDRYTTLRETEDRIFCTSVTASWLYTEPDAATEETWHGIRKTILETFAEHDSLSVQHTLYAMGEAALEKFLHVEEIALSLPNIHCIPVDVSVFGFENDNRIFVPTEEPHGLIEARLSRR